MNDGSSYTTHLTTRFHLQIGLKILSWVTNYEGIYKTTRRILFLTSAPKHPEAMSSPVTAALTKNWRKLHPKFKKILNENSIENEPTDSENCSFFHVCLVDYIHYNKNEFKRNRGVFEAFRHARNGRRLKSAILSIFVFCIIICQEILCKNSNHSFALYRVSTPVQNMNLHFNR